MLTRRTALFMGASAPFAAILASKATAQTAPIYANDAIAVDGSDVVAYFSDGRPVQGSPEFSQTWNGATWHFASAANRDAFAATPANYAPQYGGYCAWAVSQGYIAPTTPEAWTIVDEKLYLNFSLSVRRRWERNIPALIKAADANWPDLLA